MTIRSEDARAIVAHALAKASEMGFRVSVAVLDNAGWLVAFGRSDEAQRYTTEVAQGKAYSVVFMGRASAELRELADERPQFFDAIKSLGLRTLVPSPGGVPLLDGAIGISGASRPGADVEIAEAAIRAAGLDVQEPDLGPSTG